jgi:ApaG protein
MTTKVTSGIRVSVETFYQEKHSSPEHQRYVHAYRITIKNESMDTVQLMRRHWFIRDSNFQVREVEGDGVIGEQPVLKPGETHEYVSWTHLYTDIGKMHGYYTMQIMPQGDIFEVRIPEFTLMAPVRFN